MDLKIDFWTFALPQPTLVISFLREALLHMRSQERYHFFQSGWRGYCRFPSKSKDGKFVFAMLNVGTKLLV